MIASHDAPDSIARQLAELVQRQAAPAAAAWFQAQLAQAASASGREDFLLAFASAGRRLGSAPLIDTAALEPSLSRQFSGRGLDETGRAALLLTALGAGERDSRARVADLFYKGGAGEKQAVLRALPFLAEPRKFLELAIESVRSSVQTVFEAIACENPYPADHFDDAAFNQMVLKALFNEVRTGRIFGLEPRAGPELKRMAQGYAAERRAAGRSVPADIDVICALVKE